MAIDALLVYNVVLDNNRFEQQIETFIAAFKKHRIRLRPVSNTKVFKLVEENPSRFAFAVFWDKDLHIARYLEEDAHIPVFNSQQAIATCNDKAMTFLALRNYNIPTPKTIILPYTFNVNVLNFFEDVKAMIEDIDYPFLLKERHESIDGKVYIIQNEKQFKEALLLVGKKSLLVQEYIPADSRRNIRVNIVGGNFISAVERIQSSTDDKHEKLQQVKVKRFIKRVAQASSHAVGADFAAIDILVIKKRAYVYGVKTNASTIAIEEATGMYLTWYIARHIKRVFRNRRLQYYNE
jgi:gamma-F420-2:alpha-L-glutamate ligase